jgi:hypothetical protein
VPDDLRGEDGRVIRPDKQWAVDSRFESGPWQMFLR